MLMLIASLSWPASTPARAETKLPAGFTVDVVVKGGLNFPTAITWASDGRMFIAQKDGRVRILQDGALLSRDFINISDQVNDYADRGLLSLTLHPKFPAEPYVYLLFTYDPPGVAKDGSGERVSRLIRVTADPKNTSVALPNSQVILLGKNSTRENIGDENLKDGTGKNKTPGPASCEENGQPIDDCLPMDSHTHTIGMLRFDLDGALLVSNGEGAETHYVDPRALRAQDLDSLGGKILRIDPITGNGYLDNPFFDGNPTHNRSKILNYGLRNPFRFTVHPQTGELYISDVGWQTWEEINIGRGKNFGWPCYEGNDRRSTKQPAYQSNPDTEAVCAELYAKGLDAVQAPLHAYLHIGEGVAAVIGGDLYLGNIYPAEYRGAFFFADYNEDSIKYLTLARNGKATVKDFGSDVSPPDGLPVQIVTGPDSNLYYVVLSTKSSEIRRIRYTAGGNTAPIVQLNATPISGKLPLTIAFSSTGTLDPDAQALKYQWVFGDNSSSAAPNPTHTYTKAGTYTVTLSVTDSAGATSSNTLLITAGNSAPVATITSPINGGRYNAGDIISFKGAGQDAEDGALPGTSLHWILSLQHNSHLHPDFFTAMGQNGTFIAPDHGDNTSLKLCLTVIDKNNLSDIKCVDLAPNTVKYTFTTQPGGLQLIYEGAAYTTPFTVEAIVHSQQTIIAPVEQFNLVFDSWSNGKPRSQTIAIGEQPQTITAVYKQKK